MRTSDTDPDLEEAVIDSVQRDIEGLGRGIGWGDAALVVEHLSDRGYTVVAQDDLDRLLGNTAPDTAEPSADAPRVTVSLFDTSENQVGQDTFTDPDAAAEFAGRFVAAMGLDDEGPLGGSVAFWPGDPSDG